MCLSFLLPLLRLSPINLELSQLRSPFLGSWVLDGGRSLSAVLKNTSCLLSVPHELAPPSSCLVGLLRESPSTQVATAGELESKGPNSLLRFCFPIFKVTKIQAGEQWYSKKQHAWSLSSNPYGHRKSSVSVKKNPAAGLHQVIPEVLVVLG